VGDKEFQTSGSAQLNARVILLLRVRGTTNCELCRSRIVVLTIS